MFGIKTRLRAILDRSLPPVAVYTGAEHRVWCAGAMERAPSIAEVFCGEAMAPGPRGRCRRSQTVTRALEQAANGAVSVLFSAGDAPAFADPTGRAIVAPLRIALTKQLPGDTAALMADIRNSTTQEDLRRIRKAGFTFRTTRDLADIRRFHADQYRPLVARRFPEDGWVMSVQDLIQGLDRGGELVCADLDGAWVAGLFNWVRGDVYAMGPLGIRHADQEVRNKRVVSGLLVASMDRAVALGLGTASLGFSLPFLGKGPIWFKAKWGCQLAVYPSSPVMQVFVDLRHAHIRKALADSPVIHRDGADLAASAWLLPGDAALATLLREMARFPGLSRWYVLAGQETLTAAAAALRGDGRIVPVAVGPDRNAPLWLGSLLRRRGDPVPGHADPATIADLQGARSA